MYFILPGLTVKTGGKNSLVHLVVGGEEGREEPFKNRS
jgi:hypothetical protein